MTRRILALAERQHGVVALDQLQRCGLSGAGVRHRVSAGQLHRIHREVYAVGRPELTARGRWLAAVLACGPGAFLSHTSAAALYGIRASTATRIEVTVTRPSPITRAGVRAHRRRTLDSADIAERDGIPVTSVARTLLDLASIRRIGLDQLERACEQAVVLELFDRRAVEALLRRSRGARGIRRLRAVLARGDLGDDVPASGLERRYRDLCAAAGLPKPEINRYLLLGDEYHRVDFLWRRQRVVIETDGGRYHATGWQRARDARRDALLDTHGYHHDRVPEETIAHEPHAAVEIAHALLRRASPGAP